jgi:hypothetical protein
LLVADLDGVSRAREECEEVAAQDPHGWRLVEVQFARLALGNAGAAVKGSKRALEHPERLPYGQRDFVRRLLEHIAGELSQGDLARSLGAPFERSCGHLAIALVLLSQGDRAGARDHLRQGIEAQAFQYTSHDIALALRGRMEMDPTWPPGILLKK